MGLTPFGAKLAATVVIALTVFPAFLFQTTVGLALVLVGALTAALLIGSRESAASEAFVAALAPGWVGFSAGVIAAYITVSLPGLNGSSNMEANLPLFAIDVLSGVFVGIGFGFVTGVLSALVAAFRAWASGQRGRARRRSHPAPESDDPNDPFGWRKQPGGNRGSGGR